MCIRDSVSGASPNAAAGHAAGPHDISVISGRPTEPAPLVPGAAPTLDLRQQEVISPADGSPLRAGVCSWRAGARDMTLAQAEIYYVVEGVLEITAQGQTRRMFAGDAALLPGGVALQLATPTWVKVFYVGF